MSHFNKCSSLCVCLGALVALTASVRGAEDPVFSGPQAGEKATPFTVVDVDGASGGKERILLGKGEPGAVVLVFVHGIERSIVPLLTVVDQYGHEKREALKTEFVFLTSDRVASEKRLPLVRQSLRMQCPMTLSVDGAEGPGNYGLNNRCLMTIVVTKDREVTANFALVQPGVADAPEVIKAMAGAAGDEDPPTAEALRERRAKSTGDGDGNRRGGAMKREGPREEPTPEADGKDDLPGAAPTDEKLIAMLRSFIRKTNDDAAVDRIAREVEAYVKDDADLTRQAVGGWTRVLHLKYGTEYAQKAGQELVDRLKK